MCNLQCGAHRSWLRLADGWLVGWMAGCGRWGLEVEVEPVKPENLVAGKTKLNETEAELCAGLRLHL